MPHSLPRPAKRLAHHREPLTQCRSPRGFAVGRLLYDGNWDLAHQAAQELETPEGFLWHAIIHRREPDPENASYWYRRAVRHPIYPALRDGVAMLPGAELFAPGESWDPLAWVKFWSEAHRKGGPALAHAKRIDELEIETLFGYCAMTTSKAAVLHSYHQPLEIREFPLPESPGPGELFVRVQMAGICGTDIHLIQGELSVPLPVVLGHETVGVIEAAGEGLDRDWRGEPLAVGDRITWASSISCGECYFCRVKRQATRCRTRKAYGISYCSNDAPHLRGGYAQYIVLRPGTSVFKIPEAVSTDSLIGAGCALTTAIHGVERCPIEWGDAVAVQGAGPVGLAAIAVARQAGAGKIIAIGGPAHRLEIARRMGADVTVDIGAVEPGERIHAVQEATGSYGADVVIECVGLPPAVNEGIQMVRDGGKFLVLGQYANAGDIPFNPHTITRKQLQIVGSWGFEPRHVDRALRMLELGDWGERFAAEITHRFPLDQANEAMETVRRWQSGKAVLIP